MKIKIIHHLPTHYGLYTSEKIKLLVRMKSMITGTKYWKVSSSYTEDIWKSWWKQKKVKIIKNYEQNNNYLQTKHCISICQC